MRNSKDCTVDELTEESLAALSQSGDILMGMIRPDVEELVRAISKPGAKMEHLVAANPGVPLQVLVDLRRMHLSVVMQARAELDRLYALHRSCVKAVS